ncbi:tRNA:m(4)X modification enzyme TRM13 [Clonorchis sinensis]|uniref:tRNA:m(4)X modification enzyme TRM13 n=1 Tax=Clonorchis sinensis TaxID=79923 RepID=A0A8T1MNA8_CLOSI|nr:tRNA:m(4)X modification enzyme TRM13 [Clonorchis sinensis]
MEDLVKCHFFLPRKKRFCRFPAFRHTKFCVHHIPTTECTENGRIRCPYGSNHTVDVSKLEKHLSVCPNNPLFHETPTRINSANHQGSASSSSQLPPINTITQEVILFLEKLRFLKEKLKLDECEHLTNSSNFERAIDIALHNPRHWSVNGFPGRLVCTVEPSLTTESTSPSTDAGREAVPPSAGSREGSHTSIPDSRGAKRHIYQNGCLVNILRSQNILSTDFNYVEFGAGRGGLSHWVNFCLAFDDAELPDVLANDHYWPNQPVDTNFILVEQNSIRYKFDTRHREAGNFIRLRMDIAQLDLKSVPALSKTKHKPIVALAKHLCGDATDLALRCLKNASKSVDDEERSLSIGGALFAVCCHHQCSWEETVGRMWLESEAGLTAREFAIAARLSSWATCGFKRCRQSANAEEDNGHSKQPNTSDLYELAGLTNEERISIGHTCKRLINWGRLCFIKNELKFPEAVMCTYTTVDVTPENLVLVASSAYG